jgi:hypothetical protein
VPYVFLDFEASSLTKVSYPIEVGWVCEDGNGEAHLIRPAPGWTEWDESAEVIHHISRRMLETQGEPHDQVCARLLKLFEANTVLASAPSWDGHWLSMLLRASGLPRHLQRLQDTEIAFLEAAHARGTDDTAAAELIAKARAKIDEQPAGHRAEADARREWAIWRAIVEGG